MNDIEIKIDNDLDRAFRAAEGHVLLGGVRAVREATRGLEKDLEAVTRSAVRGRLWRAWQSETFPERDVPARTPQGVVFVKGRSRTVGAIDYWSKPGVNRAKGGGYLAIPTKNAGVLNRERNLTPGEWERKNGVRLRYVYRGGGKPALLVADNVFVGRSGSGVRAATPGRAGGNYAGVSRRTKVIFILIAQQRHANTFNIKPLIERAERNLVRELSAIGDFGR